jgi:hypothetical protein
MTAPTPEQWQKFLEAGDLRDGVERACDDFNPTSEDAVPLGRGRTFTQFHDIDQAEVRIVLSSAAMRECCRVFIKPREGGEDYVQTPEGQLELRPLAPTDLHLCRCMAAEMRRALDEAFDYTLDRRPRCSHEEVDEDQEGNGRFFLSVVEGMWIEVTKEEWVAAERGAGFNGPLGVPATAGFSNGVLRGRVSFTGDDLEGTLLIRLVDRRGSSQ